MELVARSSSGAVLVLVEVTGESGARTRRRIVARIAAGELTLHDIVTVQVVHDERVLRGSARVEVDLPMEVVPVIRAVRRVRAIEGVDGVVRSQPTTLRAHRHVMRKRLEIGARPVVAGDATPRAKIMDLDLRGCVRGAGPVLDEVPPRQHAGPNAVCDEGIRRTSAHRHDPPPDVKSTIGGVIDLGDPSGVDVGDKLPWICHPVSEHLSRTGECDRCDDDVLAVRRHGPVLVAERTR